MANEGLPSLENKMRSLNALAAGDGRPYRDILQTLVGLVCGAGSVSLWDRAISPLFQNTTPRHVSSSNIAAKSGT
jgi:hypothetical protein